MNIMIDAFARIADAAQFGSDTGAGRTTTATGERQPGTPVFAQHLIQPTDELQQRENTCRMRDPYFSYELI